MKNLLTLIIAAGLLTGCVQYKDGKPVNPPEEKEKPVVEEQAAKEEAPKEELEKAQTPQEQVEKALKKNSKAEFLKVNGQFIQEPYSVQVEYLGKENLSSSMTTKGMKMAVLEAVYAVKGLKLDISDVGISVKYPLVDKLGNTTEEYVIKSDFDKETIDKLNDNKHAIDIDNLPDIATSWWEHPAIQ